MVRTHAPNLKSLCIDHRCALGGILSPILANIYLNELDKKIAELKQSFYKPAERSVTREYGLISSRLRHVRESLKTAEGEQREMLLEKLKLLKKQALHTQELLKLRTLRLFLGQLLLFTDRL